MKKQILTLVALCLLAVTGATAQIKADLTIKHGTVKPEMDGNPNDAVWSLIEPVAIEKKFQSEDPSVTASFKMYYTDDMLYILLEVADDKHYPAWVANDLKNNWMYDKIEMYFDINDNLKDGNGPAHNGANTPPIAPGHAQFAPSFEDGMYGSGVSAPIDVVYNFLSGQVFWAYDYKAGDQNSYTIEYEIPLNAFINDKGQTLDVNAFKALPQGMGFDLTIVDNDDDGKGRKRGVWKSNEFEAYVNMDECGVIVFGDEELPGGSGIGMLNADAVTCYPNPVMDILTVEGDFDHITLTNLAGQQVKATTGAQVNVADLTAGLYIVKAYKDGVCKGIAKITKE